MKAVIFDMDGVIVDSELQWEYAEQDLFKRLVPRWRPQDHHRIVGLGVEDLYYFLAREYGMRAGKDQFVGECHELAVGIYGERVTLTPGFRELFEDLKKTGMPIGLASSSPRAWIDLTLKRFELTFETVASADDVPSGKTKPQPDIYLVALSRMKADAASTLAIEDSVYGIKAAKAAGLRCAALRNGHNDALDLSQADFELRGFSSASAATLRQLSA